MQEPYIGLEIENGMVEVGERQLNHSFGSYVEFHEKINLGGIALGQKKSKWTFKIKLQTSAFQSLCGCVVTRLLFSHL